MIDLIFYFGTEIIFVRVNGKSLYFSNSSQLQMASIDGLRFDYAGVLKEYPDLEGNKEWKSIALERFKKKIAEMKSEDEIADYVIKDLKMHGYVPKIKQKAGFRRELIQ